MVAGNNPPRQGTVTDLITRLLDRDYNRAAGPVLRAIATSTSTGLIEQRLNELDAEARRLAEAEQRLDPDNPVLRALMADLKDTLRGDGALVGSAAEPVQQSAINSAGRVQRQLALPGMTDQQLARIGVTWTSPDPEAVTRLVQYTQSDAFRDLLRQYPDDVVATLQNQAVRGISLGWSPLHTSNRLQAMTQALPARQANTILRTLQTTSYRDATAIHQNANIDLAQQIVRIAALDMRTCLSCVAQHGDIIWDSDRDFGRIPVGRVDDHWNGRCTSAMIVKGRPHNIQTGEDWFNSLTPARQAQQRSFANSPGKLEAFREGRVALRDFVHAHRDDVFGPMLREAGLAEALNK